MAGARLHCEAALKLAPDLPGALELLGELCARAGEPLRALRAFDRLRDVALGRHELGLVGRANLRAGEVWEQGLHQLDNALLRYREAVSLLPGDVVALVAQARVSEALGRVAEAVTGYQQAVELAGPSPGRRRGPPRCPRRAPRARRRWRRAAFGDPTQAREHWEAALSLVPDDAKALEALVPAWRAAGDPAALARALERAAPTVADPVRRAAFLAEAGELQRTRLRSAGAGRGLLARALDADPQEPGRARGPGGPRRGPARRTAAGPLPLHPRRAGQGRAPSGPAPSAGWPWRRRTSPRTWRWPPAPWPRCCASSRTTSWPGASSVRCSGAARTCPAWPRRSPPGPGWPRRSPTPGWPRRASGSWRRSRRRGSVASVRRWWRWRRPPASTRGPRCCSSWPTSRCAASAPSTPGGRWRTCWSPCPAPGRRRSWPRCGPGWARPAR